MKHVIIAAVLALSPLALAQDRPASSPATTAPVAATAPAATPASAPAATGPASRPAPVSPEKLLAAESLRHEALSLIYSPSQTPGRAGRLILLSEYACRLEGDNPQVNMLLTNIYEVQGLYAPARKAIERRLIASPQDYSLGLAYLRMGAASLATAEQRLKFLQQVADRKELDASTRATALVLVGQILTGQNDKKGALEKFEQALALDGRLPEALMGQLHAQEGVAEIPKLAILLKALEGSPINVDIAWEVALTLQYLGAPQQAIVFFDYAWELLGRQDAQDASAKRATEYFNAMLDAGLARKAIETFAPRAQKYKDELAFNSLLVEAYRATNQEEQAKNLSRQTVEALDESQPGTAKSQQYNEAMAWYYLVTDPKDNLALTLAQKAVSGVDHPSDSLEVALEAARLRSGQQTGEAIKSLETLAEKDALANFFLAEHYFRQQTGLEQGKKFLAAGLKLARGGQAYRLLAAMAKRQGIAPEPNPQANAIRDAIAAFNDAYLQMGLSPQRYIEVNIKPVSVEVGLAQGVAVEATLKNISTLPVPTGPLGLLNPVMSLRVKASGNTTDFGELPMATWIASRYIQPGQTLRTTVRLDVGDLERYLLAHPLDSIDLTVSGIVDPVQRGTNVKSSIPTLDVAPAKLTRTDILGQFDRNLDDWGPQYQRALGLIVRDIKRGDLAARMRAAREVGALLTLVSDIDAGRTLPSKQLVGKVKQLVLLSMLNAIAKDPAPEVRAEALAAIRYVRPNTDLVTVLTPLFDDKDPLVQFRAAEFLGASRPNGWSSLIKPLGSSSDTFVREMANLFISK